MDAETGAVADRSALKKTNDRLHVSDRQGKSRSRAVDGRLFRAKSECGNRHQRIEGQPSPPLRPPLHRQSLKAKGLTGFACFIVFFPSWMCFLWVCYFLYIVHSVMDVKKCNYKVNLIMFSKLIGLPWSRGRGRQNKTLALESFSSWCWDCNTRF